MVRWSPRPSRATPALVCLLVVLAGHMAMLQAWRATPSPPARAVSVQVRQLPPAVAIAKPEPTMAPDAMAVDAPSSPVPPRRPAAPPRAAIGTTSPQAMVPDAPESQAVVPSARESQPSLPAASEGLGTPAEQPAGMPVYATRIPPSTQLHYTLRRGSTEGDAVLAWRVEGERYRLHLQATIAPGRPLERQSQGGFDDAGLAPLRLADQRNGRDVRAANFQREQRKISFSGPRWEWPLHAGAQDRVSWLVQLVAIAEADPQALRDGSELAMWVVGTRGALSAWRFEVRGRHDLSVLGGASAWWLVREPEHPYDLRIEVWLDPTRGHWPLRLRQTQVPGGEPLEWTLRDEPQALGGS